MKVIDMNNGEEIGEVGNKLAISLNTGDELELNDVIRTVYKKRIVVKSDGIGLDSYILVN